MARARPTGKGREGSTVAAVAFGVCLWLSWAVIVHAVVERGPNGWGARLTANSPTVLTDAAEIAYDTKAYARASALARRALGKAPFSSRALRTLGLSLDAQGSSDKAEPLMTLAGNWDLRDTPTHAWLFQRRLKDGELDSAVAHLDSILRRRADLYDQMFPQLQTALVQAPPFRGVLADQLTRDPPWRSPFLAYLTRSDEGLGLAAQFALAMKDSPARLSDTELRPLFSALVSRRQGPMLLSLARALGKLSPRPVNNPGFERDPKGLPFDWEPVGGPGLEPEITEFGRSASRSLQIHYDGRAGGVAARQLIALAPGRYRLSSTVHQDGVPRRLGWTVQCLEGAALLTTSAGAADLAQTPPFDVPAQGCALQWLSLQPNPGERQSEVYADIDNVNISTVPAHP